MKLGIVWRTNVGKSTLFNKVLWNHRAITTDISWTTRETFSELTDFDGNKFVVFDSPWLDNIDEELDIVEDIIKTCNVLIFMVDAKVWPTAKDEQIKDLILKNNKISKTLLLVNKVEWNTASMDANEFYQFWFEYIEKVSLHQEYWLEVIRDFVLDISKKENIEFVKEEEIEDNIPISILGRPNTWKSTMLNKLYGDEIAKVKDEYWTTLDYIKASINYKWDNIVLYDTAGIRKSWKTIGLERIAFSKTYKLLERVQPVCIIVFDMEEWLTHIDKSIIWKVEKLKLPTIIALNKTDLFPKQDVEFFEKFCIKNIEFAKHLPIISVSWKTGYYLDKLLDFSKTVYKENYKKVWTSELNTALNKAWIHNPPRFPKNKICKFYYVTQIETAPPRFVVFVNNVERANFSFKKWIENVIRKNFGFIWCFIDIKFKPRS